MDNARLASVQLPPFLFPSDVLHKYGAVRPFLEAAFVRVQHCSHFFLQKADDLYLSKMAWLFSNITGMFLLGLKVEGSKLWKDTDQQVSSALLMAFMLERKAELFHGSFTIGGGLSDQMFSHEPIWKAAGMREGFPAVKSRAL